MSDAASSVIETIAGILGVETGAVVEAVREVVGERDALQIVQRQSLTHEREIADLRAQVERETREHQATRALLTRTEHELEALVEYLDGAWVGCHHTDPARRRGCPVCDPRWSDDVRAAARKHYGRTNREVEDARQEGYAARRAEHTDADLEAVTEAICQRADAPEGLPPALRLAWAAGRMEVPRG